MYIKQSITKLVANGTIQEYTISELDKLAIALNPFTYRSYIYDPETNLYYLNSRYYDPETGRFVNADDVSVLTESQNFINGLNLYSYCSNNPILHTDEAGNKWWHWLIGGLILTVALVATIATGGAAAGTLAFAIHGIASSALTTGLISAGLGFVTGGLTYQNGQIGFSLDSASNGFMWGAINGTISGALSKGLGNLGKGLIFKDSYQTLQGIINGSIAAGLTLIKGVINKNISGSEVFTSLIFGFTGGLVGTTSWGEGLRGIIMGVGLGIAQGFIDEVIEYIKSLFENLKSIIGKKIWNY